MQKEKAERKTSKRQKTQDFGQEEARFEFSTYLISTVEDESSKDRRCGNLKGGKDNAGAER